MVGPTWLAATDSCERLSTRAGVSCSVVVVESGSPRLELDYASEEDARRAWKQDVAEVGGVFCSVAARHGLLETAEVRMTAPGQSGRRSCRTRRP